MWGKGSLFTCKGNYVPTTIECCEKGRRRSCTVCLFPSLRRREMQYRCQSLGDDTEHDRQIVYLQLWRRQGHPRECPYSTKIMACDSHAAGRECCPENFIAVSSSSNIIVSHSKGHGMLPYEGVVSCPWVKERILHGTGHPFPDSNVYIVSVQLESYISVSYHPSKPSWLAIYKDW